MTAFCAHISAGLPLMNWLFDPVSLAGQVANTPLAVYGALLFSMAAAYLGLWWIAPDYRVFRSMGVYVFLCGVQMVWVYEGGTKSNWLLIALTAPVLVMIAGDAMHIANRQWTLMIWPFSLLVVIFGGFHGYHFLQPLPVDVSDIMLFVLIVQGYRRGKRRERQISGALAGFLVVRWTLSSNFRTITHAPLALNIGGWSWVLTPAAIELLEPLR